MRGSSWPGLPRGAEKVHKVIYLPLARADILNAVRYIADRLENPTAAAELLSELDKVADTLSRFPYAYELYRTDRPMRGELRKVPVKGYVLYYAVTQDTVEIRRLIHGRRKRDHVDEEAE